MSIAINSNNHMYLMARELENNKSIQANLSAKMFTTKVQLKQHIESDVEIYKLLGSGNIEPITDEELLQFQEVFLQKDTIQKDSMSFPCTHSMLEKHWVEGDYEFVFANGYCALSLEEEEVLIQRGVLRFGCYVGISVDMLLEAFHHGNSLITIQVECKPENPYEKRITHKITYGLEMLSTLCNNPRKEVMCPGELSEVPISVFDQIKESLQRLKPLLEKAKQQSTRPYICEGCKGWKGKNREQFERVNQLRSDGEPVFCCGGCSKEIFLGEGCSTITCISLGGESLGCGAKTCVYCLNGSTTTGITHTSLGDCTEKTRQCIKNREPFPLLKACTCCQMG